MKRWLIVALPLAILTLLLFIRPPAFSAYQVPTTPSGSTTTTNGSSGLKPGSTLNEYDGSGKSYVKKPAYEGHEADKY